MKRKWQSSLGRFSQMSYKPKIKSKYLIIFLYFWLHNENQKMNLAIFTYFFSFPKIENLIKEFEFLISLFGKISQVKKARCYPTFLDWGNNNVTHHYYKCFCIM